MKKKLFAVLTAVMIFAMSTTVLAAGSPGSGNIPPKGSPVNGGVSGELAKENISGVSAGSAVIVAAAASTADVSTCVSTAKSLSSSAQVMAVADYNLVSGTLGAPISVGCAGIMEGDNVVIIHIGKSGTEIIKPDSVSLGMVTFSLKDLSPVAIVKLPAGTTLTASKVSGGAGYTKSPKTGDSYVLLIIAMTSLAGAFVCYRRIRTN